MASKPPPAKKRKAPSGSAAAQIIKQYLDQTNRPWSVTNIVDSLAPTTGLSTGGAKKALQELSDSEQVDFKAYGKQTFYLSKQSQYVVPPEDEVKREEASIRAAKEKLDKLRAEQKELKHHVDTAAARQTDAQLREELAALRSETTLMEEKLRASKSGQCKLSLKDVQKLEETARQRLDAWKVRKRATKEVVERIAEATGKRPRDIFNDMGCDEDPGYPDDLPLPKICFDDTLFKQSSALVKPKPKRGLQPRAAMNRQ